MTTQPATKLFQLDYVKTIGIVNNGTNGRGFANPYDAAIAKDGRIFVLNRCDPGRAKAIRIGICNLDEECVHALGKNAKIAGSKTKNKHDNQNASSRQIRDNTKINFCR